VKTDTPVEAFRATWDELFARADADAVAIACLDLSGVVKHARPPLPIADAGLALAARAVADWRRYTG
jgi:aspartate/glutamate racemase